MNVRHPPGRGGRLWLARRIEVATTGADLLDKKRRALVQEERRLRVLARQTASAWADAAREAETWVNRAAVMAGEEKLAMLAVAHRPAEVTIRWRSITTEVSITSRRQRALERRWLPALEGAVARLSDALDELEREEATRSVWAGRRAGSSR